MDTIFKHGIDLQLFAYDPQAQPANNTGSSDLSAEMKTFYDMTLLDEAAPNLIHNQFGVEKPIPRGKGKTIEFRKFDTLPKALDALVEGVTPDPQSSKVTAITATIGQYGGFIEETDMLELTAIDNIVVEDTKALGRQAGLTLDTITRDIIHGGTNVLYAPKISGGSETEVTDRGDLDGTAQLTVDVVNQSVAKLRAQNAPTVDGQYYVAIVHPYAAYDLMRDSAWVDAHKYAEPENLYTGEIGRIGGVRFVESTEATIEAPGKICGILPNRLALKTALDGTGDDDIFPEYTIAADDATAINTAISGGATYKIYVGGKEGTVSSVTAGAPGTGKITVSAAIKSVSAGSVICGEGAAKNGMAVFETLVLAKDAYGVIKLDGANLQTIVKQLGSGGTADPLNQRATIGWKAVQTAKILHENYIVRVEHCSARYSANAQSN